MELYDKKMTERIANNLYINLNGELTPIIDAQIPTKSRIISYGDGFFESIRVINGKIKLWNYHYQRIINAFKILYYNLPKDWSEESLKNEIIALLDNNKLINVRVKLTIYRKEGGLFAPLNNNIQYFIECTEYSIINYTLNNEGLKLGDYNAEYKHKSKLNEIKSASALFYVLAAQHGKNNGFDDVVLFNENGNISETTSANIFVVIGSNIYTPPLSDNCLNGVMRQNIIQVTKQQNYSIAEKTLTKKDLLIADEIWISNAIKGAQWIGEYYSNSKLGNKLALKFSNLL